MHTLEDVRAYTHAGLVSFFLFYKHQSGVVFDKGMVSYILKIIEDMVDFAVEVTYRSIPGIKVIPSSCRRSYYEMNVSFPCENPKFVREFY